MAHSLFARPLPHPALWPLKGRLALLMGMAWLVTGLVMHWPLVFLSTPEPAAVHANTPAQLQANIEALQTQHASLTRTLAQQPWPEARLPQVLQDIQRMARQHGLAVEVFKPLPLRTHAQHAELPVQIKLQATHASLVGFLRDLSQLARPVVVSDLHVQAHAQTQTRAHVAQPLLSLEAKFSILRWRTAQEQALHKPSAAGPAAPAQLAALWPEAGPDITLNPFDAQRLNDWLRQQHPTTEPVWLAAERARTPQWLERYALDQLQMVGQLMQDGQRVALIKAAQRIHQVKVGHYLGPHGGRVLSIEEQALTLREIFQDEAGQWQQRDVVMKLERSS